MTLMRSNGFPIRRPWLSRQTTARLPRRFNFWASSWSCWRCLGYGRPAGGPSWYVPAFPASLANSLCEWTIWNMQFQCSHLTNLNYTSLVLRVNSPSTRWPYCRCFFFLCHCWLAICGCTPSGSVWRKYQNTLNYPRFQWILIRFSSVFPIRSAILG